MNLAGQKVTPVNFKNCLRDAPLFAKLALASQHRFGLALRGCRLVFVTSALDVVRILQPSISQG